MGVDCGRRRRCVARRAAQVFCIRCDNEPIPARMSMAFLTTSQTWFGIGIMAVAQPIGQRARAPDWQLILQLPDCAGARRLPKRESSSGRHQRQRRLTSRPFAPCVASVFSDSTLIRRQQYSRCVRSPGPCFKMPLPVLRTVPFRHRPRLLKDNTYSLSCGVQVRVGRLLPVHVCLFVCLFSPFRRKPLSTAPKPTKD